MKTLSNKGLTRQDQILEIAFALFSEKGFEHTTVQDLIDSAGISKGAFFHYFSSKEEIIDHLVDRQIRDMLEFTEKTASNPSLKTIEKLNLLLSTSQKYRMDHLEHYRKLFYLLKEESNLIYRERFIEKAVTQLAPAYGQILVQGIQEKIIFTSYPYETAELIIRYGSFYRVKIFGLMLEGISDPNKKQIIHIADFLQDLIEKLLGIQKGEFNVSGIILSSIGIKR